MQSLPTQRNRKKLRGISIQESIYFDLFLIVTSVFFWNFHCIFIIKKIIFFFHNIESLSEPSCHPDFHPPFLL